MAPETVLLQVEMGEGGVGWGGAATIRNKYPNRVDYVTEMYCCK